MKTNTYKWYGFIPNLLTLLNLTSGIVGVYLAFMHEPIIAIYCMMAGAVFDFFDGFAARLLKVSGELGKQLDSLADMITFGLLPGVLVFMTQGKLIPADQMLWSNLSALSYICLLSSLFIPIFSALRLAKFNIDTQQSDSFIGLPTPANALFFASLVWTFEKVDTISMHNLLLALLLMGITVLQSMLLVSRLPLFSLKVKGLGFRENLVQYTFLLATTALILAFGMPGIAISVVLYIVYSLAIRILKR